MITGEANQHTEQADLIRKISLMNHNISKTGDSKEN